MLRNEIFKRIALQCLVSYFSLAANALYVFVSVKKQDRASTWRGDARLRFLLCSSVAEVLETCAMCSLLKSGNLELRKPFYMFFAYRALKYLEILWLSPGMALFGVSVSAYKLRRLLCFFRLFGKSTCWRRAEIAGCSYEKYTKRRLEETMFGYELFWTLTKLALLLENISLSASVWMHPLFCLVCYAAVGFVQKTGRGAVHKLFFLFFLLFGDFFSQVLEAYDEVVYKKQ